MGLCAGVRERLIGSNANRCVSECALRYLRKLWDHGDTHTGGPPPYARACVTCRSLVTSRSSCELGSVRSSVRSLVTSAVVV